MEIQFFEETHTYIVDGEIYPSCTQVLEATGNWPAFWNGPDRDFYMDRGAKVHKAIFHLQTALAGLKGALLTPDSINKIVDNYIMDLDPVIRGYVQSWNVLRRDPDINFAVVEFEQRVASKELKVAGTLDALGVACLFLRASPFLGDYKCGEHHMEYGYQTAGYTIMRFGAAEPGIDRGGIHLQKDGSMPILKHHDRPTDFVIFATACELYHQMKERKVLNGINPA